MFESLTRIIELLNMSRDNVECSVYVSIGTMLYNGEPENELHISEMINKFPKLNFVRYVVDNERLSNPVELHNLARITGVNMVPTDVERWILFLDGDEIPESYAFARWFLWERSTTACIFKMANYWYFIHPTLVSADYEDSVLLVHSSLLSDAAMHHYRERDGIILMNPQYKVERSVLSNVSNEPMFHHYSWVRANQDGILRKVANWGHTRDRDWNTIVKTTFANIRDNQWPDRDFVHGHRLVRLESNDTHPHPELISAVSM
jgi:hypothetical protein